MFAQFQITCMCILCKHMCWGVKHILRENTTISIANLLYSAGFGNSRPLFQYLVNFTWLRTKWDRYWCVLHKGVHVLLWRAKARCWRIANDEKGKHRLPGCIRKLHVKCHGLTQILFPILHLKLQTTFRSIILHYWFSWPDRSPLLLQLFFFNLWSPILEALGDYSGLRFRSTRLLSTFWDYFIFHKIRGIRQQRSTENREHQLCFGLHAKWNNSTLKLGA